MKFLATVLISLAVVCLVTGTMLTLFPLLLVGPTEELGALALTRGLPLLATGGILLAVGLRVRAKQPSAGVHVQMRQVLPHLALATYLILSVLWASRRAWRVFYQNEPFNLLEAAGWLVVTVVLAVLLLRRR